MILTNTQSLIYLSKSNIINGDRTFKTVREIFYHMHKVQGREFNHIFSIVYALAIQKDEHTYK